MGMLLFWTAWWIKGWRFYLIRERDRAGNKQGVQWLLAHFGGIGSKSMKPSLGDTLIDSHQIPRFSLQLCLLGGDNYVNEVAAWVNRKNNCWQGWLLFSVFFFCSFTVHGKLDKKIEWLKGSSGTKLVTVPVTVDTSVAEVAGSVINCHPQCTAVMKTTPFLVYRKFSRMGRNKS